MSILLTALLLAAAPAPAFPAALDASPVPAAAADVPLHCRVLANAGTRRCAVAVPAGRAVRECDAPTAAARRCDATRKYAVHVVATGGAKCAISKKRTDWTRAVVVAMSKKSARKAGAACDLYVELR